MRTGSASIESIEKFLAQKRIAMIGISRDPKSFSMSLFDELCRRGYDVVPVNPNVSDIKGQRCFARVQDIQPPVTAALLMTSPQVTEQVAVDCADAGIRQIWMYRAGGAGAVSPKAVAFCQGKGMDVIPGECPFMFLPDAAVVHRFHGFFRKITGRFPRHRAAA
jgi:predicted CoA-binding protein